MRRQELSRHEYRGFRFDDEQRFAGVKSPRPLEPVKAVIISRIGSEASPLDYTSYDTMQEAKATIDAFVDQPVFKSREELEGLTKEQIQSLFCDLMDLVEGGNNQNLDRHHRLMLNKSQLVNLVLSMQLLYASEQS